MVEISHNGIESFNFSGMPKKKKVIKNIKNIWVAINFFKTLEGEGEKKKKSKKMQNIITKYCTNHYIIRGPGIDAFRFYYLLSN